MKLPKDMFRSLTLLVVLFSSAASAQDISVSLSSREGYVGLPIVLQVLVTNARRVEPPETPKMDGCEVELAGPPSQSTRTTIINGRRSTSRSLSFRFQITPQRVGEFEVPGIRITADGLDYVTESVSFVVSEVQTGDLLFAEVSTSKASVYVGEPLEQTLKIWIKPFRDESHNLTLSESDMWQMVSEQSSWGSFGERIEELERQRRRPSGREVLREDRLGERHSYYLYEVQAETYPTRPGRIDATDVRIIVNYPTQLRRGADPFSDFSSGSPFNNDPFFNSPFRGSPFGNLFTIESVRPVVANAQVDTTEVLPIPTAGRPADYRGAVGRYRIVSRAEPLQVKAGDPITLQIGVGGSGPMELVQAPPLAELPDLTKDFKVTDQDLPGYVQDNTKMFSTTIRPRAAGVHQIPAIPLSYFNPATKTFETAYSEPIAIEVSEAETLALDAIVGARSSSKPGQTPSDGPNLDIYKDEAALARKVEPGGAPLWLLLMAPSVLWIVAVARRWRRPGARLLAAWRSPITQAQAGMSSADSPGQLTTAMRAYIARRTKSACETNDQAVGQLRLAAGRSELLQVANAVETWLSQCNRSEEQGQETTRLAALRSDGMRLLNRLQTSLDSQPTVSLPRKRSRRKAPVHSAGWLLVMAIGSAVPTFGDSGALARKIELTPAQQRQIFAEANALYDEAAAADGAVSHDMFLEAAAKYEQLTASGASTSQLYFNLGNANLRAGRLAHAIGCFERARRLAPSQRDILQNLRYARRRLAPATKAPPRGQLTISQQLTIWSQFVHEAIGPRIVRWLAGLGALGFWSILAWRLTVPNSRVSRWTALAPLALALLSAGSIVLAAKYQDTHDGIVVVQELPLRAAAGEAFPIVHTLSESQGANGALVDIRNRRGEWLEIGLVDGRTGWAPESAILALDPRGELAIQ